MQAGAHRNAERTVQDRPGQGRADRTDAERDHARAGDLITEYADVVDLSQLVRQHLCQQSLLLRDRVDPGGADEPDTLAQPGDARQVGGACLQPPRVFRRLAGTFGLEPGAALAERLHQQGRCQDQHAGPHRPV